MGQRSDDFILMGRTSKVTISLDSELLSEADRIARRRGLPRSVFMAKALRALVLEEKRETRFAATLRLYRRRQRRGMRWSSPIGSLKKLSALCLGARSEAG